MSKEIIKQIMEGNHLAMNETIKNLIAQKAALKLEKMKQTIGKNYFGKE